MKYLRVILAYEEKDKALLDAALETFIEGPDAADMPFNGIQGAYISRPYDDRESACDAPFENRRIDDDPEGYINEVIQQSAKLELATARYYHNMFFQEVNE